MAIFQFAKSVNVYQAGYLPSKNPAELSGAGHPRKLGLFQEPSSTGPSSKTSHRVRATTPWGFPSAQKTFVPWSKKFAWQGMGIWDPVHIAIPCSNRGTHVVWECTSEFCLCLVLEFAIERDINEERGIYKEYMGVFENRINN